MRDKQERAVGNDNFEKSISDKQNMFELIKEVLISTTEEELKKKGYKPADTVAGIYGDKETYGVSPENEKYIIKVSGKTLPSMEKTIQIGGKRLTSAIKCVVANNRIKINYNSPENTSIKNLLVRKELSISADLSKEKIKKELEKLFSYAAFLEVNYLQDASLGTEYGMQNYYNPNKPNLTLIDNTMTIKEIFTNDSENLSEGKKTKHDEEHINKVKEKNTIPLDGKKGKKLLFDKKNIKEIAHKVKHDTEYKEYFQETLKDFGASSFGEIKSKGKEELKKFFNALDKNWTAKNEPGKKGEKKEEKEIDEITAVGGGFAATGLGGGAGAYLTPYFAKHGAKSKKKDMLKSPYVQYADNAELNESLDLTKKLEETAYFKNANAKKPQVDKNWNLISEGGGDPYNIPVKIDPNTHPQGMPFIVPNCEDELIAILSGDPDKLKRIGVKKLNEAVNKVNKKIANETEFEKIQRLSKKKFGSILENEEKGINKRYIITEKTTEEFEKERMKKLSGFKLYESIKEAENLDSAFEEDVVEEPMVDTAEVEFIQPETDMPNVEIEDVVINEEFVEVEKPGSVFGLKYKFKKADFLNENKKYILDLNSMVFVPKPNQK
jgi:hypothetical protein